MKRYAKYTKLATLSLVISMLPTLAACSNNNNTSNNEGAAANNNQAAVQNAPASTNDAKPTEVWKQKFDPPVTITSAVTDDGASRGNAFKPGESMENNAILTWMKDNIGIEVKYDFIVTKPEDYDTKLRLLLSSGGKLPDVFGTSGEILQSMLQANKLMPLDEAIEKYAHPEYKKMLEKLAYTMGEVKKDGHIYGIPAFFMGDEGTVMWVRKDWLDNLGLKAPTTLAEFEEVIKQFTENDPDKNGKNDTVGLAVPLKEGPWTWMGQTDAIVGALTDQMINTYDVRSFWNKGADGKLSYGAIHPDAKKYLETMKDWMNKGYIDKEAGIKDPMKTSELVASGKAGVIFGPFWMGDWPLSDAAKVDAKADFEPYALPASPDGKVGRAEKPLTAGFTVFNKDFKNIEAWFAYFNKMFAKGLEQDGDPYYDPSWKNGFMEGYDYVTVDGKVIKADFKENGVPEDKWPLKDGSKMDMRFMTTNILAGGVTTIPFSNDEPVKKFLADPNADALTSREVDVKAMKRKQIEAAGVRINQGITEGKNYFTGPVTPTMKSKGQLLQKLATEAYLKIIYGDKPIEYFDEFVKEWLANGGEKITEEVNDWYAKNQ
ncbi:extracellular solute-binding protein [Paenibacillus sp. OV219]|uniref:extracellular solute-binding protein n=1 Tax=Paenibacillus sp. OV219 TaxID=1884377 RepID=UPI0008D7960A|nr:extracellular solute-binding protein [Paenibacillus sp. OV219]SEN06029.1 aldotetraouronic acid ABC transporter substrate-binding protein /aldotetraouronic acid ABC transporter substrate-binding protein [Paenibacillus sp. OV219]